MINQCLQSIDAACTAHLARYKGAHRVDGHAVALPKDERQVDVTFGDAIWCCSYATVLVSGIPDATDMEVHFRLTEGGAPETVVGACLSFTDWSSDNYVLLPAAVYNGNRFEVRALPYPPLLQDPADIGVDVPTIITDTFHLNNGLGESRLQLLTRDLATPAVGVFLPGKAQGLWILIPPNTNMGDIGIAIEESPDRTQATIRLTTPGMREDVRFGSCSIWRPSEDQGMDFQPGDEVCLRLRVYVFPCANVQGLFDRFVRIRQDLTGSVELAHELPLSAAWAIQEEKYNRQNWVEKYGYYSVGMRENRYQDWQVGWVGGMMVTHPLLLAGQAVSHERALRNFDFLFNGGQTPSGLFHGVGQSTEEGMHWFGDEFTKNGTRRWHLIRKSADALYFLIKQFMLLAKQDPAWEAPLSWTDGTLRCADAFVRLWERYGQFGQFVDEKTGEIIVGGSTSASTAPAGLALASQFFHEPGYLQVAVESATFLHEQFTQKGYTTGGPGEILQCPDSESSFGLLESFVVLYEVTGDQLWVERAREMAHQCATWCVSYDYPFPANSLFGRLGMRSAGSVWANVQNMHSAPGICTLSGDSLFKLFRATGDRFYLELVRHIAHNITQYLSRKDRPVGKMPSGWMTERVNLSDWLEGVGEIFEGSCWCEVSCMLTYVEVPGLYVQPDTGLVCAIDHVEAAVVHDGADHLVIEVTNPTNFVASIRVLVEKSTETVIPLGQNALWGCQQITVAPGDTQRLEFAK